MRFSIFALIIPVAASVMAAPTPPKGFKALFDGESMDGWYTVPENQQATWSIDPKQGTLAREHRNGYAWTKDTFGDFILMIDFKMSRSCNSGIFFRTDPKDPVQKGFEIQLYDTPSDMEMNKHTIGALYDAQAASVNPLNPYNKWNTMKLHVQGDIVKIWINDVLVNEADLSKWTTPELNPDGTPNKFKTALSKLPKTGHIGLQDHGHNIAFRNIFIKKL